METALIGLLGIILGIIINEYLRRARRLEMYSSLLFERRLNAYEKLYKILNDTYSIIVEVLTNDKLTKEERHGFVSSVILQIAEFSDNNALYIDGDLGAHCTGMYINVEDIAVLEDSEEKEQQIQIIRESFRDTKKMIMDDAGVSSINKLFKKIQKTKLSSPLIDYINELRKEQGIE